MTPAARIAAVANILDALDFSRLVDPQLKAWSRKNRYAGSGDRRAIADRVYTCLRRYRSAAAIGGDTTGRALVLGSLIAEDRLALTDVAALCDGPYGLAPLTPAEQSHLAQTPSFKSEAERLDWPDWLMDEARRSFGDAMDDELAALRARAALDLRVNTLKATRAEAKSALEATGVETEVQPICDTALRAASGTPIINLDAYLDGLVELQDAASQAVAAFAQVAPGQKVLDFCAGAGGKTLAFAASMKNRGSLTAHDINPRRMEALPQRAKRAGATIIRRTGLAGLQDGAFDAVIVDAPCSGSGSWRRDPLAKWRLTAERLAALQAAQLDALDTASRFVRPAGTLTYATCSVLSSENQDQVAEFSMRNPDYTLEETLELWPHRDGTDGFYAARFRRNRETSAG